MSGIFGSITPAFDSMDEAQCWILATLLDNGRRVAPRGHDTIELSPMSFCLRKPRRRFLSLAERRWSLPLAIGEFCWHASGSNDVDFIGFYANRWREFSADRRTISGSCYGRSLFRPDPCGVRNWDRLISLLRSDPDTRRAIVYFGRSDHLQRVDSVDVACASSVQFLMRERQLDAVVHMRSNDAVWGLPYDVFLFTMLQELLAVELEAEIGVYHHMAGSMHIYSRHVPLAKRVRNARASLQEEMPRAERVDQLPLFLRGENAIRCGRTSHPAGLHPFWIEMLEVLAWYSRRRSARGHNPAEPTNGLYRALVEHAPEPRIDVSVGDGERRVRLL